MRGQKYSRTLEGIHGRINSEAVPQVLSLVGPFDFIIWAVCLLLNLTCVWRAHHRTLANGKLRMRNTKVPISSVLLSPCVSVHLGLELFSTIYQGKHVQAFVSFSFLFVGTGSPRIFQSLSLLTGKCSGADGPFIIPSKLSLFPSLSFIISPVSSEADCRSLPISLCLSAPASASRGANVQGKGQAYFLCSTVSLRRDMPLLTEELRMGSG